MIGAAFVYGICVAQSEWMTVFVYPENEWDETLRNKFHRFFSSSIGIDDIPSDREIDIFNKSKRYDDTIKLDESSILSSIVRNMHIRRKMIELASYPSIKSARKV